MLLLSFMLHVRYFVSLRSNPNSTFSLPLSSSSFSIFITHTNYTCRNQLLNSIKSVTTVEAATNLFHKMVSMEPFPSLKDFTFLFSIIVKMKHYTSAISLIKHMHSLGIRPHIYTLNIVINCLCLLNHTEFGFSVLGLMFKIGLEPDIVSLNTLIHGLCIQGNVAQAVTFAQHLENMGYQCDRYTHGMLIYGLCKVGHTSAAISYLHIVEERNCNLDVTLTAQLWTVLARTAQFVCARACASVLHELNHGIKISH